MLAGLAALIEARPALPDLVSVHTVWSAESDEWNVTARVFVDTDSAFAAEAVAMWAGEIAKGVTTSANVTTSGASYVHYQAVGSIAGASITVWSRGRLSGEATGEESRHG
ncbi:hypothetical protein [Embleya scabrispora]|uniref:hypothetical protein n=1 Tax=Embleya scabrispora TaxID=159449 RepID=UPI001319F90A|nr:hypothetical protein [Embleya scabrispora]MYS86829.1 hypothetical protein [Streptomyces sp. SID5474]